MTDGLARVLAFPTQEKPASVKEIAPPKAESCKTQPVKDLQKIEDMLQYLSEKPMRTRDEPTRLRNVALLAVGINALRRISELLLLRVDHVVDDLETMRIRDKVRTVNLKFRRKNKQGQAIETTREIEFALSAGAKEELRSYLLDRKERQGGLARNEALFFGKDSMHAMSVRQAESILAEAAAACGVSHFGTHGMRKTKAYHLIRGGQAQLWQVSELLGHTSEKNTRFYLGLDQEEKDQLMIGLDIRRKHKE